MSRLKAVLSCWTIVAVSMVLVQAQRNPTVNAISDTTCNGDVQLIRVRGSGDLRGSETFFNRPGQEGVTGNQLTLDGVSKAFRKMVAQRNGGVVNEWDLNYPARSTGAIGLGEVPTLFGYKTGDYNQSVEAGVASLKEVIGLKASCGDPIVLIGYSQGAWVIGDALADLPIDPAKIQGIALFGDPRFDPNYNRTLGDFTRSRQGILGLTPVGIRTIPAPYTKRTISICVADDLICQGPDNRLAAAVAALGVPGGPLPAVAIGNRVLEKQKNAHARGYACEGRKTDAQCRAWIESDRGSLSKTVGKILGRWATKDSAPPPPPPAISGLPSDAELQSILDRVTLGCDSTTPTLVDNPFNPRVQDFVWTGCGVLSGGGPLYTFQSNGVDTLDLNFLISFGDEEGPANAMNIAPDSVQQGTFYFGSSRYTVSFNGVEVPFDKFWTTDYYSPSPVWSGQRAYGIQIFAQYCPTNVLDNSCEFRFSSRRPRVASEIITYVI